VNPGLISGLGRWFWPAVAGGVLGDGVFGGVSGVGVEIKTFDVVDTLHIGAICEVDEDLIVKCASYDPPTGQLGVAGRPIIDIFDRFRPNWEDGTFARALCILNLTLDIQACNPLYLTDQLVKIRASRWED